MRLSDRLWTSWTDTWMIVVQRGGFRTMTFVYSTALTSAVALALNFTAGKESVVNWLINYILCHFFCICSVP
jgi:hypothetical protein